jgi:O-antigen/teichoic acid export membrane protein
LAILVWTGTWVPLPLGVIGWFFALVVVELAAQELGIALIALSRPLAANLVLFIRTGLWTYPVMALTVIGRGAIESVFLTWFLGASASVAVAAWSLRGMGWRAALTEPVDWLAMRAGLRIAAPFVVTTGASMGLLFVDRFIIAAAWGLGAVGVYTFLAGITTALNTLVNTGVSMIRMPRLVKAYQDADARRFGYELGMMLRITTITAALLAAGIAIGIVPLLQLVGKAVYEDNLGTFFLLLGGAVIRSIADVPMYALYAKHRDLTLLGVTLGAFGVAVTLNLVLVPAAGIQGAALAAVAGASTLLVLAGALVVRGRERMSPPHTQEAPPARLAL